MSEIGLDSYSNGEDGQATVLDWQIRTTFASGCAGAFVFPWTDEWCRRGQTLKIGHSDSPTGIDIPSPHSAPCVERSRTFPSPNLVLATHLSCRV